MKNTLARPDNLVDATRWDEAVSSIWFYLLGPGYQSKNEDVCVQSKDVCVAGEYFVDKHIVVDQVKVGENSA
jgi:hypothetical protein